MTQIATPEILRADLPLAATDEIVVAARDLARVYGEGETAVHAPRRVSVDFPRGPMSTP
jgi:hypothetical protein